MCFRAKSHSDVTIDTHGCQEKNTGEIIYRLDRLTYHTSNCKKNAMSATQLYEDDRPYIDSHFLRFSRNCNKDRGCIVNAVQVLSLLPLEINSGKFEIIRAHNLGEDALILREKRGESFSEDLFYLIILYFIYWKTHYTFGNILFLTFG